MSKIISKRKSRFVILDRDIISDKRLKSNHKLLYALLASLAESNDNVYPSYKWLAEQIGYETEGKTEVALRMFMQRNLEPLIEMGLVEVKQNGGSTNDYFINDYIPENDKYRTQKDENKDEMTRNKNVTTPVTKMLPPPVTKMLPKKEEIEKEELERKESVKEKSLPVAPKLSLHTLTSWIDFHFKNSHPAFSFIEKEEYPLLKEYLGLKLMAWLSANPYATQRAESQMITFVQYFKQDKHKLLSNSTKSQNTTKNERYYNPNVTVVIKKQPENMSQEDFDAWLDEEEENNPEVRYDRKYTNSGKTKQNNAITNMKQALLGKFTL